MPDGERTIDSAYWDYVENEIFLKKKNLRGKMHMNALRTMMGEDEMLHRVYGRHHAEVLRRLGRCRVWVTFSIVKEYRP
jgi:hypothetical protein